MFGELVSRILGSVSLDGNIGGGSFQLSEGIPSLNFGGSFGDNVAYNIDATRIARGFGVPIDFAEEDYRYYPHYPQDPSDRPDPVYPPRYYPPRNDERISERRYHGRNDDGERRYVPGRREPVGEYDAGRMRLGNGPVDPVLPQGEYGGPVDEVDAAQRPNMTCDPYAIMHELQQMPVQDVTRLQMQLERLGLGARAGFSPVDGEVGRLTTGAVLCYASNNNLDPRHLDTVLASIARDAQKGALSYSQQIDEPQGPPGGRGRVNGGWDPARG